MLGVSLKNIRLSNPTVLASGILGVAGETLVRAAKNGAGAITTKSIGIHPREGHPNPCILTHKHGLINAVGLCHPAIEDSLKEIEYILQNSPSPLIVSIHGKDAEEFAQAARMITQPASVRPAAVEVNISCPNVQDEFGKPFASDPILTKKIISAVKNTSRAPVIAKLSPNVPNIKEIARAAVNGGADMITAINTLGPGMIINLKAAKPILSNKSGGISGPCIKPIAVRCVYDIYEETKGKIPIIGTGGITTGEDAIEIIMAGASAVGIGSGIYYRGIGIFKKVCREMEGFMIKNGYRDLDEIRGIAHEK